MIQYSGCDVHREYSVFVEIDEDAVLHGPTKVRHRTGELEEHLSELPKNTPIAIETSGHWYWIADRIEEAGHEPRLVHASRASKMMGNVDKTDKLDAQGLAMLQKAKTLPEVWMPSREQREKRELLRYRMKLVESRTRWKNRTHALLMKHGRFVSTSDAFGEAGREQLESLKEQLPACSRLVLEWQLGMVDWLQEHVEAAEEALEEYVEDSPEREHLQTIPGIGPMLSATLAIEIGDIRRFDEPGDLASYAGVVPGTHASGGSQHDTGLRNRAHQTLKWAYLEAANSVIRHQEAYAESRLVEKYRDLAPHKASGVAKGAVARMLAESSFWVLTNQEAYVEPDGWHPPR